MFTERFKYWLNHADSVWAVWEKRAFLIVFCITFLFFYGYITPFLVIPIILRLVQ